MNLRNYFALLFVLLSWILTYTNAQFRIINGQDINVEESPHSVAIFHKGGYRCVGSLVSTKFVVTAAHCVINRDSRNLVVLAGVTDIRAINTGRGQQRDVENTYHDPDYDPQTRFMDVAMVKVYIPFQRCDTVQTILLCNDPLVPGLRMQISGWGSLELNSRTTSPLLKTKSVQITNTQRCRNSYANLRHPVFLAETIMCAGCSGADMCLGDSGAAGVLNGRLCAVAQGICGYDNLPGLYTNVTNPRVQHFIKTTMLGAQRRVRPIQRQLLKTRGSG
ncbi:trypsin delta-like [Eurosta solidaginis]|uniref:trypsin delta-like n=1 Tax=Eurosta solidaginis TaxID=178769 RepID=UPI00353107BF